MTTAAGIEGVARELAALVDRLEAGTANENAVLAALEGLRTSLEELRVADDELTQQAEELLDAHAVADAERRRYEDLFASAPIPYLVTDLLGTIEHTNAASTRLFAVPKRFLEGKPISVFVSVPQRREFRRLLMQVAADPVTAEFRLQRRRGVAFDAAITIAPVIDRRTREIDSLRWTIRDVTDERHAERRLWELNAELESRVAERTAELTSTYAELSAQRAQLETIIQNLPAAVIVADDHGRVVVRNSRAEELFGDAIDQLETLAEHLVDPDGRPQGLPLAVAESDHGESVASFAFERPGGDEVLLEATVAPVEAMGRRTNVVYVFHDVTMQRRRDLAQREFVVNAAHELRTPLAAIVSSIEVLQAGGKDDLETREVFLAHLERESGRLVRLARSLLLLSRAQSHEERPPLELVPLREILTGVADGVHPAPGVTIEVDCDDELAGLVNEDLLRQALSSLVDNAVRFTERGRIALRAHAPDERLVAVEVVDTGPGLTVEEQAFATSRFVRGSRSTDGFGLGLSIAAEAARAAGGELELESQEGVGTTARIVVQLARLVTV